MFEKLKKYLNDYSKGIDEQPQQEYDKSLRDLWEKNAELALNVLAELNVQLPSRRIKNIYLEDPEVCSDKKTFLALCSKAEFQFNYMRAIDKYERSFKGRSIEKNPHRDFYLDILKSILSEDYRPPDKTEDAMNHLSTLHLLYSQLMPTTPGLSNIIPLRAGYALVLLTGNALFRSFVADDKKFVEDQRASQKKADDKKEADMLDLISQVCDELTIDKYRTPDGIIKRYSMAGKIQKRFKEDEKLKKRLGEIDKRYKNGTKIPSENTIVKYLDKMNLSKSQKVTF